MRIIVARHGQTDWNAAQKLQGDFDIELNDTGREQASLLRDAIRHEPVDVVYTSDLKRAQETAYIVNQHFEQPVFIDERLKEFNWGIFSGMSKQERDEHPEYGPLWQEVNENIQHTTKHEGDFFPEFQEQIHQALTEITNRHEGQTILIVTHGFAKRVIVGALLGKAYDEMKDVYWTNTAYSIFQINETGDGFTAQKFNESPEEIED